MVHDLMGENAISLEAAGYLETRTEQTNQTAAIREKSNLKVLETLTGKSN